VKWSGWCGVCCLLRADQGKDIYHKVFPRIANVPRRLLTLGLKGREEHNVSSTKQTVDDLSNFSKAIRCWTSSIVRAVSCGNRRLFWLFKQQRVTLKELPCSQTNCLIVSGIPALRTESFNARRFQLPYCSVSQPLWDHGLVNSFFIRRGPGPNRFTHQ